jgi:hypothetical protein
MTHETLPVIATGRHDSAAVFHRNDRQLNSSLASILSRGIHRDVRRIGMRLSAAVRKFLHGLEKCMSKIEYKVALLPYKTGIFNADSTEVAEALNKLGEERWRLSQIVLPSTVWGRANTMVAILERAKA